MSQAHFPRFTGENLEKNKQLYAGVADLAFKHNCTPPQLALAWLLHQEDNIVPIPGKICFYIDYSPLFYIIEFRFTKLGFWTYLISYYFLRGNLFRCVSVSDCVYFCIPKLSNSEKHFMALVRNNYRSKKGR